MAPSRRILVGFYIPEALRDLLGGITRLAMERKRNWLILCVNADEFDANFRRGRCDGAIIMVRPETPDLVRRLSRSGTAVVNLLRNLQPRIPSVLSDDHAIGQLGAQHLRSRGLRKLAFVSLDATWSRSRLEGYAAAIRQAGLPAPSVSEVLKVSDFRFRLEIRAIGVLRNWVRKLGPGTGIMAPSDFAARTLLDACQIEAIDVPRDIAILGVDNFPSHCQLWPVSLSSIAQDFAGLGFEAARLLDDLMTGRHTSSKIPTLIPPGRLHVRASSDTLAFDDPIVVDALREIRQRALGRVGIDELLKRVPLSRRWLDARFKLAIGHTPAEEIRQFRLRAARDLLIDTDMPLRQIAFRSGFSFPENLIRDFRTAFGISPHRYRLKHRSGHTDSI